MHHLYHIIILVMDPISLAILLILFRFQNMTMVLTMGPLTEDMLRRPRYWLRLFSVLSSAIQCQDISPLLLQVDTHTHDCHSTVYSIVALYYCM